MKQNKDIEVRTYLTEDYFNLMNDVVEAKGLNHSSYLRTLVHQDINNFHDQIIATERFKKNYESRQNLSRLWESE